MIQEKEVDNVNHPSHYCWLREAIGIEPIDIARLFDFNLGNALKYILRSGRKKEQGVTMIDKKIEDLKKAVFYLQDEIKTLESTPPVTDI